MGGYVWNEFGTCHVFVSVTLLKIIHNLAIFKARSSKFCVVVDLDHIHGLYHAIPYHIIPYHTIPYIPKTTQFKTAITQSIFELGAPDFMW